MNVPRLARRNIADEGAATAKSAGALRMFLWGYALVLLALIVIQVTFTRRNTWGDEDGLYNAIYMYQHYGKVTYPMQLQFDYMTIHPPTHYFVIGVLARAGLQVFHAAAVPLVLMALFAFAAVLTSAFSDLAKFSVLTGFTLAALVYIPLLTIRPDMQVTFAWFCGLVFLEAARSLGWENKRLFIGSFFIAYASGLHYPALPSALILPVYFLYILLQRAGVRPWTRLRWRRAIRKLAPMAAGALLFYIPFAFYFVIPHFQAIRDMLKSTDATGGGLSAAMRTQYQQFNWVNTSWPLELPFLGKLVFSPVSLLGIPPLVCAIPVLLLSRSLRGMALAGAILPLFVFTMVSRKGGLFYIAPELTLYAIAVSLVFFFSIERLWRYIQRDRPLVPYVLASVLAALVLVRSGAAATHGMTWELTNWDVARAANQRILSDNAFVAINQCYAWYTSGAAKVYWIVTPTNWDYMERIDRKRNFDSILLIGDWFANRHLTIPFPEFYVDGKLNLRGFYFPGRYKLKAELDQMMPLLHLTARKDLPKQGFGYDQERNILNQYSEDDRGAWMFVSFKAFLKFPDEWPNDAVYLKRFDMEEPKGTEPALFALVTSRENWLRDRAHYAALGTIRDEVPMRMQEIKVADLLRGRPSGKIEFMTNQVDLP
jgi:hypothetical protein